LGGGTPYVTLARPRGWRSRSNSGADDVTKEQLLFKTSGWTIAVFLIYCGWMLNPSTTSVTTFDPKGNVRAADLISFFAPDSIAGDMARDRAFLLVFLSALIPLIATVVCIVLARQVCKEIGTGDLDRRRTVACVSIAPALVLSGTSALSLFVADVSAIVAFLVLVAIVAMAIRLVPFVLKH